MAQAGPNNQFGGRQGGLASLSYQSPGGNDAPVAAARKQAPTKPISTSISEMSIMPPYCRRRGRSVLSYVNGGFARLLYFPYTTMEMDAVIGASLSIFSSTSVPTIPRSIGFSSVGGIGVGGQ